MLTLIAMMVWLSDFGLVIPWYVWTLLVIEAVALVINLTISVYKASR